MLLTKDHTTEVYSVPNRRYYFEIVNNNGGYEGALVMESWPHQTARAYISLDGYYGLSSVNKTVFANKDDLFAIVHKMDIWKADDWFISRKLPLR